MKKLVVKNKASKPSYQSFFPNYKLSGDEKALLLMFEEYTGIVPNCGDTIICNSKEDFRKCFDANMQHFRDCCDEIADKIEKKQYELLGGQYS